MGNVINEEVSVDLIFDSKTKIAKPWVIKWRDRSYKIDKIGLHHQAFDGRVLIHYFSVCSGETFLKLAFNTLNLHWRLEEIS